MSLLRGGGIPADEMNIAGYTPGPIEAWEVTVPVDGIRLSAVTEIATLRLLPGSERPILPVGLGPDAIRDVFNGADVWARTFVTASTAYDAELSGNDEIALSPQEREAIEAWRRAVQEPNSIAQTAALWEAVEFIVAGRTAPQMFSVVELDALRARAVEGLNARQSARLLTVLEQLNGASLFSRLRKAAANDGVPVTEDEWACLSRVRRVRNHFAHGARELPEVSDLRIARAIVNRLIVHRVHTLTSASR